MTWSDLGLPQCWIVGVIIASLVIKSYKQKWRAPSMDDFVELIAYFAGLFGTKTVVVEAIKQRDHLEIGLPLMASGALLAYVSIRGIWRTLTKPPEVVKPTNAPNP